MKTSNDVFDLVKSMTQTEKRYFKRFASLQSTAQSHNSVALFDVLNKLKAYDETRLKKNIQQEGLLRNLASEKVYLHRLLMKSLRAYHLEKSPSEKASALVFDAHILLQKGLDRQAKKALAKAKRICKAYQFNSQLLTILHLEREMIKQEPSANQTAPLTQNLEARIALVEAMQVDHAIGLQYDRLFLSVRSKYQYRTAEELALVERLEDESAQNPLNASSTFHSQLYFQACRALAAQLKGDLPLANQAYRKVLDVWNAHPNQKEVAAHRYLRSLGNYLGSCHMVDHWEPFPGILAAMEAVPSDSERMQLEKFKASSYHQLLYALSTGELDQAKDNLPTITQQFETYEPQLTPSRSLGFCYNFAILFLFLGSYDQALVWINKILNHPRTDQRQDIQIAAQLLQIMVHFELGNLDLLPFLARSLYRKLKLKAFQDQFEHQILSFLQSPDLDKNALPKTDKIESLLHSLGQLLQSPAGKGIPGLSEVYCWLRSKRDGIELLEVYRELMVQASGN